MFRWRRCAERDTTRTTWQRTHDPRDAHMAVSAIDDVRIRKTGL
jgi:hypothetical protein